MIDENRTLIHKLSDRYSAFYIWFVVQKNLFRSISSPTRILPNFIIFAASRSGTRSLNKYLQQHPSIQMASRREVHFFNKSDNFRQGLNWYKSFFPTKIYKFFFESKSKSKLICGDATPDYIYNPEVPLRIKKSLPNVKLIAVLRNPIDRAYSHYHYMVRTNRENLSFEEAIRSENDRIKDDIHKKNYDGDNYRRYSYLRRGIYVEQLKNWMSEFPKQQFMIIKSEDLENEETLQKTLDDVFKFLDIHPIKIKDRLKINVGKYTPINSEIRKKLSEFFYPHNENLSKFLNMKFEWD